MAEEAGLLERDARYVAGAMNLEHDMETLKGGMETLSRLRGKPLKNAICAVATCARRTYGADGEGIEVKHLFKCGPSELRDGLGTLERILGSERVQASPQEIARYARSVQFTY